jgi:hypothetical protein
VTREALRILHQKLNFVGSIVREYDDSFAKSGAKIGDSLKIRLPNQYVVRTGATLVAQDTTESSVTLQVATQKGVDLNFTSVDLTLSLDDFAPHPRAGDVGAGCQHRSRRALDVQGRCGQSSGTVGRHHARQGLGGSQDPAGPLAPLNDRTALLNTQDNVDLVDALKALFRTTGSSPSSTARATWAAPRASTFENTLIPAHSRGDATAPTSATPRPASPRAPRRSRFPRVRARSSKGDVFTIVGVNRVHPETKADTGALQFVVTADGTTSHGRCRRPRSPRAQPRTSSSTRPGSGKAVVVAGTASTAVGTSLLYQKEAFAFATADLVMPSGVDFAKREVMDGISMRIVRQYDINNDKFPCRLDVLYGYKTLRSQLAVRLHNN